MATGKSFRVIWYILMMALFFLVLYVLDVAGVHYEPDEHRLNQPKKEQPAATGHTDAHKGAH